jgi:hypothetical protein
MKRDWELPDDNEPEDTEPLEADPDEGEPHENRGAGVDGFEDVTGGEG